MSRRQLLAALRGVVQNSITVIEPIQWYYEYVTIEPIWDDEMLIYRAKLPLVKTTPYLYYRIDSWPLPYNTSGYSIQVNTMKNVGLDTQRGWLFTPRDCVGHDPIVCRFGIQFKENYFKCEQGILSGDHMGRQYCEVTIKKSDDQSIIEEISPSEFVLVTWGEQVTRRCLKSIPTVSHLVAGVYLVKVEKKCSYSGRDWRIDPILELRGRLSILSLQVNIEPLKIKEIIDEKASINLFNDTSINKLNSLEPVIRRNLKRIDVSEMYTPTYGTYNDKNSDLFVVLSIVMGIIIGIIVVIVSIVPWRKNYNRCKLMLCKQTNEEVPLKSSNEPIVYFKRSIVDKEGEVSIIT